jgi:hypothetical protein
MNVNDVVEIVMLFVVIAPLILNLIKYIGTATNNKSVSMLADRAMIIVSALDSLLIPNSDKKKQALKKLVSFANETGVKLTESQADDYIEHAVRVLHELQDKPEVVDNAPEEK